ncbi:MAG: Ribonuclease Y [Candidatus Roizmanbacteria bacterium GW2011_GWB1_40_7]|uniref:Ribonuclease Y n=2 Tax=Candidatus Roizmaniibacteriota TaxID=1752723 RepID=A0A0G0TCW5_9BACT|nr:MAG: Ribonuclease Y [Candidatus Roizmanbacteria bacterium GW2011_GWB1_40_7]KKR94737.1 MAG: Ribonuclease Y [Candidatus Roizmanbacteria bacterium GW2011_GWA1_41_13]
MSLLNRKSDQSSDDKKILEEILKRENLLEKRKLELDAFERELKRKEKNLEEREEELTSNLQKSSKLTSDEARKLVIDKWEQKLQKDIAEEIKAAQEKAQQEAKAKAQEILVDAMKHAATDYVAEYTVSTVKVQDEEIKGRIIGKDGRNIRTFEKATGVDVDLDEAGIIRLSSFDPVRREIARVALLRLIKDGRIQPARIEEMIQEVRKEIDRIMYEEGEKLAHTVEVYNLPKELIALLGRFKFRFSYGQNMIAHTLEETKLGIKLAHEVGVDVNIVKLGCLLHDIGKVVMDKEGNHVELGVELLKRHNMPKEVVGCVAAHHEDIPFPSVEAVLVYISDAISGARPGARMEDLGEYVKRMKELEAIPKEFPGIEDVYAMQAGREIRVIVDPKNLDDSQTMITAQKIKDRIKQKFPQFPGSIKITLIRELQVTEVVK